MKRVKLYKVTRTKAFLMEELGMGFSLHPWGKNSTYYEGEDDGGKEYVLPDSYELAESATGLLAIFDPDGEYCTISALGNTPVLVTSKGLTLLRRADRHYNQKEGVKE